MIKTYILQFISKDGNGWAIINAHSPNQAEAVFYTQTRFESTKVTNIKESRYYGEEMQLVYEGSIITKPTSDLYTLAIQNGYTGTLEEFIASQKGEKGNDGAHVTSLVKTSTSGLVDTYTITFNDGTSQTFTVTNGQVGQTGGTGPTGKSAYQSYLDTTSDAIPMTEEEWIMSLKGTDGTDGKDGVDGENGIGFGSIVDHTPNPDGIVIITLTNGDTITLNLNHNHNVLVTTGEIDRIKFHMCEDETEYTGISTKDANTLYLIPESAS